MSDWQDAKKAIKAQGPQTFKWVNVYDSGQWHAAGDYVPSLVTAFAIGNGEGVMQASITVSSVADLVRQVNAMTDTKTVGLRLFGPARVGPLGDYSCYVSIGRNNKNDTSGDYSLQINATGDLIGSAAHQLGKLNRVTKITMMDVTHFWHTQLFYAIGTALPGRYFEIRAHEQNVMVRMDRVEREEAYKKMLEKEAALRNKPIQDAKLETGALKHRLNELSGKDKMAHRVVSKTYVVAAGDSLSSISSKLYGNPSKWKTLYDANKHTIGANPNVLRAGMELFV